MNKELAILGGAPLFEGPLHVGRPTPPNRERFLSYVNDILDRNWLTNSGPLVQSLEQQIASYLGVRECVAVSNGTVAIELVLRALELTGEVIVPAFTFVATAHAPRWHGLKPIFADVSPVTHQIDVSEVEKLITPATTAILAVNLWGAAAPIEELALVAERHGLILLFDSAHGFGSSCRGRKIGGFGSAEFFSFHATKVFNTLEGGAVTTNDRKLAAKLRLLRNFGFAGFDNVVSLGINAKMNEVCAAMGLTLLESLPETLKHNQRNYIAYAEALAGTPGIDLFTYPKTDEHNYQYLVTTIDEANLGLTRDELYKTLHAENVIARRYFYPGCHRMVPYRDEPLRRPLPNTDSLTERVLCFPTGSTIDTEHIRSIGNLLFEIRQNSAAIRERLSGGA